MRRWIKRFNADVRMYGRRVQRYFGFNLPSKGYRSLIDYQKLVNQFTQSHHSHIHVSPISNHVGPPAMDVSVGYGPRDVAYARKLMLMLGYETTEARAWRNRKNLVLAALDEMGDEFDEMHRDPVVIHGYEDWLATFGERKRLTPEPMPVFQ